jgi:3-hydroxymyristoyl/3-hydroxydecanoyl-(acyl carrier protein) dehydratase
VSDREATATRGTARAGGLSAKFLGARSDQTSLEHDLRVPTELDCWPGHFSNESVLPGVVQVEWVMKAIEGWTGSFPHLTRVEALKFKKLIRPGERLTLRLERDADGTRFRFRLMSGDTIFSEGRIVLKVKRGSEQ